jgi:hypothetical protein
MKDLKPFESKKIRSKWELNEPIPKIFGKIQPSYQLDNFFK